MESGEFHFEIGRLLFQNNIQVPQFYDLIDLSGLSVNLSKDFYYIVMDKLIGKGGWELEGHIKKQVGRQLLVEAEKIIDLGINPQDCDNSENAIFNFEENKMYLFDFHIYEFIKGTENLQKLREEVKRDIMDEYGFDIQ